jgi:hypothetical protein
MDEVAPEIEVAYGLEMDRLRGQWFAQHPGGAFKAHRKKNLASCDPDPALRHDPKKEPNERSKP